MIGGHRDLLKHYIVHQSQNIQPSTIRLVLTLAAFHLFDLWTAEVCQAYLQSEKPMERPDFF